MRVLVLGGTTFIGRRVVERLHDRGDEVLVVHRGQHQPAPWVAVDHLHVDRQDLLRHAGVIEEFGAAAVVDTCAMTAGDVTAVLPVLPEVPTVVLSSQDVYQAYTGLRTNRCESPVPLTEDSELRRDRYPYRGSGLEGVPEDYEKLDVEEHWLARGAVVLRLPMVYGPHDQQRREDVALRRVRARRPQMPIGAGNLLGPAPMSMTSRPVYSRRWTREPPTVWPSTWVNHRPCPSASGWSRSCAPPTPACNSYRSRRPRYLRTWH